jgi:hypothetical protein
MINLGGPAPDCITADRAPDCGVNIARRIAETTDDLAIWPWRQLREIRPEAIPAIRELK